MGIEKGRSTRSKLKVGICGEHGGESKSVKFCHAAGMNYVSCSPFRVPIARLAAAQAVIADKAVAKAAADIVKAKAAKKAAKAGAKAPVAKAKTAAKAEKKAAAPKKTVAKKNTAKAKAKK